MAIDMHRVALCQNVSVQRTSAWIRISTELISPPATSCLLLYKPTGLLMNARLVVEIGCYTNSFLSSLCPALLQCLLVSFVLCIYDASNNILGILYYFFACEPNWEVQKWSHFKEKHVFMEIKYCQMVLLCCELFISMKDTLPADKTICFEKIYM